MSALQIIKKRVVNKCICHVGFYSGKKAYLEHIHLLTHHYTFEVIIWPRKQGVGASKHFKITLWLAYMQVFLNWLLLAVFFLSLPLATKALNSNYFTYWCSASWKYKEKKSVVYKWYRGHLHFMDPVRFVWFHYIMIGDVTLAVVVTLFMWYISNAHRATFISPPMEKAWQ